MRILKIMVVVVAAWAMPAIAADVEVPDPGPRDVCPVCGMFVAKYPEWIATVLYDDGHAHHFDGAKDMFKYLHDLPKYMPGHGPENIKAVAVTEYYDLRRIDARAAVYVIGSTVYGPMGHELVPFTDRADAEDFMADHGGTRIVTFDEVGAGLPFALDRGEFE